MDEIYHRAILEEQWRIAARRVEEDKIVGPSATLASVHLHRTESVFFVSFDAQSPSDQYLAKIDAGSYPIDPYWIGFLNPQAHPEDWLRISDADPRYWPWSPMPGLHGSFNIAFAGPYRAFWCRPCTVQYFYYHGHEDSWLPGEWTLDRVISHLVAAARIAEHPNRWRPIQRPVLFEAAEQLGVTLPEGAGTGDE